MPSRDDRRHPLDIAKQYGMLPASTEGTCEGRTAMNNQTVRTVFVIGLRQEAS